MNRIYKVIWSKVKHQYIVVSELAHRDGKRSSIAGKSVKTMLAVCALCSAVMFGGYGMPNVYAAGADTLPGQYIAIGGATTAESTANDGHWEGRWSNREWVVDTYYRDLKDASGTTHKYVYTQGNDGNYYWVREGYSIEIVENKRYPTADKNTVINTYKGANADSDGLVQSYQNVQENMNIGTLNGDTLFTTNTDMYGGAVNTSTTAITTGQNYRIEQNGRYIEAGLNNLGSYFNTEDVVYHENTGLYTFHGQVVGTENLYVIGGSVGVFTTTANGDTLYTGDVYGRNNEILMTAVDEKGNLVSYWGAEIVDPNATIGSMTISTLEGKFDEVNKNIEKIHKDDIKKIQVAPTGTSTDGQGGTIGLQTNGAFKADGNPTGGAMIPGGIKITSEYGNDGKDVRIKFANDAGSFTVDAGSKVEGTTGEASGDTLTGLSINGVHYKLGGGKSVTSGSIKPDGTINLKQGKDDTTGITLSGNIHDYALDEQNAKAEKGKVTLKGKDRYGNATYDVTIGGLVTEDTLGGQIVGNNNLKVAVDADGDANKGNWTITDTKGTPDTSDDAVFTNTTLASGAAATVEGSAVTSDDEAHSKTYGQSYAIKDTEGNTVTISDVASASALKDVDVQVTKNLSSIQTLQGQTVNGGAITDNGTIELKHDNTTLASITGLHDYALDDQDQTAKGGKVTLKGKDRYGNATYDVTIGGLVTEDTLGDQIVGNNNLKVAVDADGDANKGNWTITDTKGTPDTSDDAVFTNTTLASGAAATVEGSAVTSDDEAHSKTYGQSYAIKDTEGNTVTISDVASASALKDVDVQVTKNLSSIQTLQGQTVNGGAITDNGTIELKHDNTTLASITGLHDYALDDQDQTAKGGKVTLKGKDRYGNATYDVTIGGLVTEDTLGDQIVGNNNLKVAVDADGDANKGNWTITDTKGTPDTSDDAVFTNTTLASGAAATVEGSAVTSDDEAHSKTYGQSYAIKDTEGNTVTISDVASASALKDVDVQVTKNLSSIQTLQGQTVNGGAITDNGTIELKHDNTTLASITGLHDYALDDQDQTAKGGKVTLKGKDRYGNATYDVTIGGLVTEDTLGDQIVGNNNLKVAVDADGDANKGNWTITDTKGTPDTSDDAVFTNTTLASGAAATVEGSAVTSDDEAHSKTYGQSYAIKDTEGNTVTISDVASASALKDVDVQVTKNLSSIQTLQGQTVNGGAITDNGTIELKHDNTTLASITGLHDYALDDQDQTAKGGKVTLKGKDRYGNATYDVTIGGLVTEDTLGDQIVGNNNLKVAVDADGDANKGNWTITDTKGTPDTSDDAVFTNTTLASGAAATVEGSAVTSDDEAHSKTYGQSYAIKDTEGNTVIISDVASASALKDVDVQVTKNLSSIQTLQGQTVNGGAITDNGTIELKHDNTTLASITGLHDYALDDQDQTAKGGKVTLKGKDRYGNATYDVTIGGLVTEDILGDQIATKNNLTVAADADGDNNKNNWTITDTSKPEGQQNVFTNTTLDVANSTFTPIGTSSDNVYGQNFTIADTAGNQFTICDIASAKKLAEVDSLAVKYGTKDGKVDPTIIELMNPYTSEDHSGGTTITNVAYADINGDGGAAVNVDLLKDTVSAAKTEMAASDQHLIKNQETGSNGAYTVNDKNEVNLGVGTIDKDGNVTQTGTVTIKDVASASDLGDVTQIHDDLKNKDENGNSIDTSVVDAVNNLDDKVGDGDFSDTTYAKNETGDTSVTDAIHNLDDAIHNLDDAINSATTIAGQHSSVSGSDNIDVKLNGTNEYGGKDYNVTLKDDLTLGGKEGQGSISIKGSEGTINATGNIRAGSFSTGNITINKDNSGTINGLSNKTWDANNIVSGQAATEDQLKAATEAAVQYDRNGDGSVNKENISLGYKDEKGNQHLTQIHNVAAGSAPTDAVNFSQLSAVGDLAINNYNNIQVLNGSINKLDNRIDRVGAGAAALAALHPLDFDPDAKWDFAAGYGNYRGANAVAVGAYYRPNEDVMFSVGGSMGGGENMVNAGVSLKIGAGSSNVTTSRVAMAKEIKSMRDIVAKQDAQIQKLTAMVNALVGIQSEPDTTTMFPDVPENHWAYEAVEAMAKSGLVKGYPDGEFKGDRTMTRYEFAQIVYNAIQAGAEVDARLVEEFKPELEYFHIATVAKDKDGNPTIERVRAN